MSDEKSASLLVVLKPIRKFQILHRSATFDASIITNPTTFLSPSKEAKTSPASSRDSLSTIFACLNLIERKRLADFTEEDARKEGGYTLEQFREVWKNLHGEWNENKFVYVIQFAKEKGR